MAANVLLAYSARWSSGGVSIIFATVGIKIIFSNFDKHLKKSNIFPIKYTTILLA